MMHIKQLAWYLIQSQGFLKLTILLLFVKNNGTTKEVVIA